MDKGTKAFIITAIIGTVIVSMYVGASVFFMDSFYFGTTLSDLKIGGKTVEAVKVAIEEKGKNYELNLYGRDGEKQTLKGELFELVYEIKEDVEQLKKGQKAFGWPLALFSSKALNISETATYNEAKLEEAIKGLSYFEEESIIEPENATLSFNGTSYDIIPEKEGNKLNFERVKEVVKQAIEKSDRVVNLEESGCYETAKFTEESPEIIKAQEAFNEYLQADITYLFGMQEEKVDAELISSWLEFTSQGEALLNEDKVRGYIRELDKKYSTLGATRQFKTSDGTIATVSGGDYGWQISVSKETEALLTAIKEGQTIYREPISTSVSQSYNSNDIGDTYVEISLTKQYLWFYKDGKLLTQGGIVTGDQRRNYSTPQGTYKLDYKQRNATLRGPGYVTPVNYWMPFNKNIGLHDATWRNSFGGNIYIANGSHGCVNAPYDMAQIIFNNIESGMPIVCYY